MIAYLRGNILFKNMKDIILDVNGVGYRVHMPAADIGKLPARGNETELHIYTNLTQDAITLFGFLSSEELDTFKMLISVSSIGPKTALSVLSDIPAGDFRRIVATNDIKALSGVSGIGKKTAERIVLELKDKIGAVSAEESSVQFSAPAQGTVVNEAIEALAALGYKNSEIHAALSKIENIDTLSVEAIIQKALINFSR